MKYNLKLFSVVFVLVACFGFFSSCSAAGELAGANKSPSLIKIDKSDALVKRLKHPLYRADKSALIEYRGVCKKSQSSGYYIRFPRTELQAPSPSVTGLTAIRVMFPKNDNVRIEESHKGVVVIKMGKIWDTILQAKIHHFTLKYYEQYTPTLAISAMLYTSEMRRAAEKLHLRYPVKVLIFAGSPPQKGEPHLPALLQNITAGEFLRMVAKTFKGIVVYGVCMRSNGKPLVDISFGGFTHAGRE